LPAVCGSAAGVRRAAVLAPAPRTPSTDGDAVEDLALCRLEAGQTVGASRVAMVNIGWGLGQGGVTVHGTAGRAVAHYRADGTMPWAPFENLTVTTADGTRTVDLPAGEELGPLVANAMAARSPTSPTRSRRRRLRLRKGADGGLRPRPTTAPAGRSQVPRPQVSGPWELRRRRHRTPRRRRLLDAVRRRPAGGRLPRSAVDRERGLHPRPA